MKIRSFLGAALLVAVLQVACAGQGCSCAAPIKGGFPAADRRAAPLQARATAELFRFLEDNLQTLAPQLLPGGGTFDVPSSCGGKNEVCCGTPAPSCKLDIKPQRLELTPTAPSQLKLAVTTQLISRDRIPVAFDTGVVGKARCLIAIDTTKGTRGFSDVDLTGDLAFVLDPVTQLTSIDLQNARLDHFDESMLEITSQPGDFLCTLAGSVGQVKQFIIAELVKQLPGALTDAAASTGCMKCQDASDCLAQAQATCTGGTCTKADGKCVAELGIDGRIDTSPGTFSPTTRAAIDLLAVLGSYARADTGVSLGLLGGARAAAHHPCVPQTSPPAPTPIGPSMTFARDTLPDGTTPYHLGVGVHVSHLDALGFAAWDAGTLCLDVSTRAVGLLSTQTLGLVIPSLADLTHGQDAPVVLAVRPSRPPSFTLGQGTFKEAGGKRVIDDPLVRARLAGLTIDFYVLVDEHHVRVMTLGADLDVPIGLEVQGDKLVPVLGDLTDAFTHVTVSNSKLLAEPPEALARAFPMLLGLAVGQLGGSLNPIALPDLMGLKIAPVAITSTDPDAAGAAQFLAIYAQVAATPATRALDRSAETTAVLERLALPATPAFAVTGRTGESPTAHVRLGGDAPAGAPVEIAWRLDGGPWSWWQAAGALAVSDPVLWLQGRHVLEARARAAGIPGSEDPTPARLELLVDTVAPTGEVQAEGDRLRFVARDQVTPAERLVFRHRLGDGPFSEWSPAAEAPGALADDPRPLTVQARDEAGNVGTLGFHGRTTLPAASGCGCEVGARPTRRDGAWALGALAVFVVLARRRSRRRRAAWGGLALGLLGGLVPGCNREVPAGEYMPAGDEVGRWHDVVAQGGVFHLSAYDTTFGDLVYARVEQIDQPIRWQLVDGVDPNSARGMPMAPRRGITEPGPDVGRYSSIALTRGGEPRIAYFDATAGALMFASGPYEWKVQVVDDGAGMIEVGRYARLSLDDSDVPAIAYVVGPIPDGQGGFKSELRVAIATSSRPRAPGDWKITTVDTTTVSCAGRCAAGYACLMSNMVGGMPNGDPARSTCVATEATCMGGCGSGEACVSGACVETVPTPKPADLIEGVGLFVNALRPAGALTLVYQDGAQGDLKLARRRPDGRFDVQLLDGGKAETDVGQFCAAAAAPDGTVHVAYVDAIADRLLYTTIGPGGPATAPEVIDDGLRDDGPHPVGAGAALLLDGGAPRVVYQDQRTADLLQARRGNGWSHTTVASGAGAYGWWPHLVADRGRIFLTQLVYDRAAMPLSTLRISVLP